MKPLSRDMKTQPLFDKEEKGLNAYIREIQYELCLENGVISRALEAAINSYSNLTTLTKNFDIAYAQVEGLCILHDDDNDTPSQKKNELLLALRALYTVRFDRLAILTWKPYLANPRVEETVTLLNSQMIAEKNASLEEESLEILTYLLPDFYVQILADMPKSILAHLAYLNKNRATLPNTSRLWEGFFNFLNAEMPIHNLTNILRPDALARRKSVTRIINSQPVVCSRIYMPTLPEKPYDTKTLEHLSELTAYSPLMDNIDIVGAYKWLEEKYNQEQEEMEKVPTSSDLYQRLFSKTNLIIFFFEIIARVMQEATQVSSPAVICNAIAAALHQEIAQQLNNKNPAFFKVNDLIKKSPNSHTYKKILELANAYEKLAFRLTCGSTLQQVVSPKEAFTPAGVVNHYVTLCENPRPWLSYEQNELAHLLLSDGDILTAFFDRLFSETNPLPQIVFTHLVKLDYHKKFADLMQAYLKNKHLSINIRSCWLKMMPPFTLQTPLPVYLEPWQLSQYHLSISPVYKPLCELRKKYAQHSADDTDKDPFSKKKLITDFFNYFQPDQPADPNNAQLYLDQKIKAHHPGLFKEGPIKGGLFHSKNPSETRTHMEDLISTYNYWVDRGNSLFPMPEPTTPTKPGSSTP